MGICTSCDKYSTNEEFATSKLILENGSLQEFHYPVKVSYLLLNNSSSFICNADEMDFDGVVSAMKDYEELQPGQLYFALPLSRLNRRLQPEEMASLAMKASAGLTKIGGDVCVKPKKVVVECVGNGKKCGGGRRREFTAKLSTIAE